MLRYGADHPDRLLCQFEDVTDRKRYESQLQFMADHDPLTGLTNRRKFEAELDRHVAHVKRYGPTGAVLVLDLDHFKTINDTLGHNAGDELIGSTAGVLRQRLRTSDILARLGGDEFAVLLPTPTTTRRPRSHAAIITAIRTNTSLLGGERKRRPFDRDRDVRPPTEPPTESSLIAADLAMYDAKEAGRDHYTFYDTSEHQISRTQARLTWVTESTRAPSQTASYSSHSRSSTSTPTRSPNTSC